jgi:Peptidase propeptide and YPEB domain
MPVESAGFRNETEWFPLKPVDQCMKIIKSLVGSLVLVAALGLSGAAFGDPSEAELLKEAKISKAQAEKTALAKVPNGAIKSGELEREQGKLIWSFDIGRNGTRNITEVQVDAKDGKIVSVKTESPRDQAKEAVGGEPRK